MRAKGRGPPAEREVAARPGREDVAAPGGWSTADADAMGRMILRYGRIASNATRHVTLLRGGINKATALLWKVVSQRITRDRDTGELISWDVGCQRMSKAKVYRELPELPRNTRVNVHHLSPSFIHT